MESIYEINELITDCTVGTSKAFITKGAMETARSDFKLNTQAEVLGFIGNRGLESPCLINSKAWENNPDPNNLIMVDAYSFYSGLVYGYIAFYYQPNTKKWVIKSFKKNSEPDTKILRKAFVELRNKH